MNDTTKDILEKYNPETILQPVLENYDPATIRSGSFVVVDPAALKNEDIARPLIAKKGDGFFKNLQLLAHNKQTLYVSALKSVRPATTYLMGASPDNFEEADIVMHNAPGLYYAPITVPVSILKTIVDPMFIMQLSIDPKFNQKDNSTKGQTLDNEYNNGKQPKGTVKAGGNKVG